MKPRKPIKRSTKAIRRIGKRGLKYKAERLVAKRLYWSSFDIGILNPLASTPCQSCGQNTPFEKSDFSHKVPAGRKSNHNRPEHGIYSCRACHTFLEVSKFAKEARKIVIASVVSMATGGIIDWGHLKPELEKWHLEKGWLNG